MFSTIAPWLSTGFALSALAFSLAALLISKLRIDYPRKTLNAILSELEDNEHDHQSFRSSLKRLNARIGMREARERKGADNGADDSDHDEWAQKPGETSAEWKHRIRTGPLRRGHRPGS